MTDEDIEALLRKEWRKGYKFKLLQIIRHKTAKAIVVLYKVTCERDGMTEYRCKGWGSAGAGWDYVTRRKW